MNIEKLPSGSYRVRKMINKKSYKFTFDHEPSEKEILLKMSELMDDVIDADHIPFEVAAKEYCKLKKNVISPSTYREYLNTPSRLSDSFNSLYIDKITQLHIQQEINRLAADKSPKTVRNYHAFIVSVLKMYRPDFIANTTLPVKKPNSVYIPTDDEVKRLMEYAKTHCEGRYYIPIALACYGLRRGEICALEPDDIKNNIVYINKDKVYNSDKEWIIKQMPKTEKSVRAIPIFPELADMIIKQGYVYDGHPNNISDFIKDACNELQIQHFSIHKLRHYFCSRLSSENIDIATIMALGGWKTDYVLRTTYRHEVSQKVQEASDKLSNIIF